MISIRSRKLELGPDGCWGVMLCARNAILGFRNAILGFLVTAEVDLDWGNAVADADLNLVRYPIFIIVFVSRPDLPSSAPVLDGVSTSPLGRRSSSGLLVTINMGERGMRCGAGLALPVLMS